MAETVTGLQPIGLTTPKTNGTLKVGGVNPGSGRPANLVRQRLGLSFRERIPHLEAIADNTDNRPGDRIKAIAELYKGSDLAAENLTADSILQHPEARRFFAAVNQALEEQLSPKVLETVRARIDQLLEPIAKAG